MLKRSVLGLLAALLLSPGLFAQDATAHAPAPAPAPATAPTPAPATPTTSAPATAGTGEDEFFNSSTVEAPQGTAEKKNITEEIEKERVGLSGILQGQGSYNMTRDFVQGLAGTSGNALSNAMMGDFLVDARLLKSFRAFVDLNVTYLTGGAPLVHDFTEIAPVPGSPLIVSENQTTFLDVKEFFVDFNASNTLYFRLGKQVLQWGTGYFWNPTDLINIEHKSFTNLTALRDGVFGLRSDVVFSRDFHLYTFLNLNAIQDITDVAFAARSEFLVGAFEFGFSGWLKSNKLPVFGTDLTAPFFWSTNLTAEASFSWGDNQPHLNPDGVTTSTIRDRLVPKVDVGLSRTFDAFDVQDRISVNVEFFYNGAGYDDNMFQKLINPLALQTFFSTYYQPGYYGTYYAAFFVTVSKFILNEMTLSVSGLSDLSDSSAIAFVGLAYDPVNNFELSLQLGTYLGPNNTEYTVSLNPSNGALINNQFFVILGAKVSF
ncbi:MAG TPA: hypothetical protein VFB30_01080 [Spirochaetia bacterium]|nr:hypothetical protein [Spirochaetia bacterium]